MERRDALKKMSLAMGGMLSATTLSAVMTHCTSKHQETPPSELQVFTSEQFESISQIVERIIPATDTPGAIEAKVPEFIDMMLSECYTTSQQSQFITGFNDFTTTLKEKHPSKEYIEKHLNDFESKNKYNAENSDASFFIQTVKELTILGYFTSEAGATKALRYVAIPGRFDACIPYNGESAFAVN